MSFRGHNGFVQQFRYTPTAWQWPGSAPWAGLDRANELDWCSTASHLPAAEHESGCDLQSQIFTDGLITESQLSNNLVYCQEYIL